VLGYQRIQLQADATSIGSDDVHHLTISQKPARVPASNVSTVSSWIKTAKQGFCGHTVTGSHHSCHRDGRGAIGLSQWSAQSLERAVHTCLRACHRCKRCNYITVNPAERDCSWYYTCDMTHLDQQYSGFLSGPSMVPHDDLPHVSVLLEVILFMHLEKTGGTTVRSWMAENGWTSTRYCARPHDIQSETIQLLELREKRIFVEHHCGIDWTMPAKLLGLIGEFENRTGHQVRFRSFTLLRSPLSLAYSQFSYWHTASGLTRQLFYQLSPELLFFRDGFKSLTGERGTGDLWCIDTEGGHNSGGGIFLDLSLQNNISKNPCSALHWQAICQRVVIARVEELTRSSSVRPSRLRGCSTMPLAGGVPQTARMTAPPTFDDVEAMQESDCRGVWLRAWHETRCLMRHAERVQRTTVELGCDALIKQAFDRLDQLSHVLFTDASQFSLSHAFEMATRGESNTTASSQRVNVGKSNVPFVASEIEPFNQCSLRFCASPGNPRLMQIADMCCCCMFVDGEAFARYSTRVPYFGVLREMGMLKLPINQQVLLAK